MSTGWPAQLTANAYNRLGQYASSPGNRVYCYAELAVSSLTMTVTIAIVLIAPTEAGLSPLPGGR